MKSKENSDTRFNKFGTVSFTASTRVNDFIDHLEQGRVMATRCGDCGLTFFPPRADCYQCLGDNLDWFEVSGAGRLVTYSKLQFAPVGFEDDLPYRIALLDYGNYKLFGRITNELDDDDIKIGMAMQTVANRTSNGQLSYVFVKKEQD